MATLLDAAALSGFSQVFAFLIVFVVVYVVLQKMTALSITKGIAAVLAFAMSLFTIMSGTAVKIIKLVTPYYVVFMFILLIVLMVAYQMGGNLDNLQSKGVVITVSLIAIFIFLAALGQVFIGPTLSKEYTAEQNQNLSASDATAERPYFISIMLDPRVVGIVALLVICSISIFLIGLDH